MSSEQFEKAPKQTGVVMTASRQVDSAVESTRARPQAPPLINYEKNIANGREHPGGMSLERVNTEVVALFQVRLIWETSIYGDVSLAEVLEQVKTMMGKGTNGFFEAADIPDEAST